MIASATDLGRCSLSELDDLHYDCEVSYRREILQSAKGSVERGRIFAAAYEELVAILMERRRRHDRLMDAMGLPPDAADRLIEHLGPPPKRLLDVGCGAGVLVEAMTARGYEADGIDVSPRLISVGRDRMARNPGARAREDALRCGNFLRAEEPAEGGYDLVYSNDVLEHIHPDEARDFLEKAHRLLRPGGVLWLITPNRWTGPGDATILRHPPGTESCGLHLKEYSLAELATILRAAGFETVQARFWSGGRFRRPTAFGSNFARVKVAIEPSLAKLPPRWRRRLMGIMDYACVLGRKSTEADRGAGGGR